MDTIKKPSTARQKRGSSQADRTKQSKLAQPTKTAHQPDLGSIMALETNLAFNTGGGKTDNTDHIMPPLLTRFKAPPSAEMTKLQKLFTDNLARMMQDKGVSQSDLAREVWGTLKDKRGYDVARNRDRISAYLAGAGIPETDNLNKIAAALGCTAEDLLGAEVMAARPLTRTKAHQVDIQMAAVVGRSNLMQISLNAIFLRTDVPEFLELYEKLRQKQMEHEHEEAEGDE